MRKFFKIPAFLLLPLVPYSWLQIIGFGIAIKFSDDSDAPVRIDELWLSMLYVIAFLKVGFFLPGYLFIYFYFTAVRDDRAKMIKGFCHLILFLATHILLLILLPYIPTGDNDLQVLIVTFVNFAASWWISDIIYRTFLENKFPAPANPETNPELTWLEALFH